MVRERIAASLRLTQAGCDKLLRQAAAWMFRVAATASEPSQHLLPATDRDPHGRLAPVRTATRAAAASTKKQ